jgi:hypothetical protein
MADDKNIPVLTPEFHRARRQLMLWSGVLFAWNLVGIDIAEVAKGEGNLAALARSLKSPQAVPWVLIILVAYFLYRMSIEWLHSPEMRREMRASKADFTVSWLVALVAYCLHFGQEFAGVQVADWLTKKNVMSGLFFGTLAGTLVHRRRDLREGLRNRKLPELLLIWPVIGKIMVERSWCQTYTFDKTET